MATGVPAVSQDQRRQALSQLEEAIRNYSGTPQPGLQNPTEVENRIYEQSRSKDEYTQKLQRLLFVITKRKSLQNLAQSSQQPSSAPSTSLQQSPVLPSISQPTQPLGGSSLSTSGTSMAGMNPGMGMARPMQPGGYPGYQPPGQQMHPSAQHTHYPPHMHRGMAGMQPGGIHAAQRTMMTNPAPGMMHGAPQGYGHAPPHMQLHSYPQQNTMGYPPHYNPPMSAHNQMHQMVIGQRHPMGHTIMRPIQPQAPTMMAHQAPTIVGSGGGMMGGGAATGGMMAAGGGAGMGGYGRPMIQAQPQQPQHPGYPPDISSGMQPVMAVPNPGYNPTSSLAGRQPVPPYDGGGTQLPPGSVPSAPSSSVALSVSQEHSSQAPAPVQTQTTTSVMASSTSSLLQAAPSPAPPTPLLPASPAMSVGSPAHNSTVTPEENEAYLRIHHELQKYIPLLTRMMNKMLKKDGEEAQKSEQYPKLKSLHGLLQDDTKRVPLPTLIKCKQALEKFEQREHLDSTSSQPPPTPTTGPAPVPPTDPPIPPTTKPLPEPKSQSLLEYKMIPSPTPTFGNLMETVQCRPFPVARIPPAKRLCNKEEPPISPSLRREIAHLEGFSIRPLSQNQPGRGTLLECTLMDQDLPQMPALKVCIPPTYPESSPECDLEPEPYQDSSPLMAEVVRLLSDTLAHSCGSYTLSSLLFSWETCLLQVLASQL